MSRNKFIAVIIVIILVSILFKKVVRGPLFWDYNNDNNETQTEYVTNSENYPDGTYCADIDYYNPDTGTRSTYTLNVEVENNEITIIHWPNGGWLDDSHFTPEELDSSGSCSFTSDKGCQYTIHITGSECSFTDENKVLNDLEYDQAALTCPICGGAKESYDEMCYFCMSRQQDEQNNQIEE